MASRGYYARRGPAAELAFFLRLLAPGFVFIIVVNSALSIAGTSQMPLWVSTPGAIAVMLGAAYWRDRRAENETVVELSNERTVVRVIRCGSPDELLIFGPERPNPLPWVSLRAPHPGLASAAIIEYVAGDRTVDELEELLDRYMRGIE